MANLFDLVDLDVMEVSALFDDAHPAVKDSEENIILKAAESTIAKQFDDSDWSGAASNWDTADAYCDDCLIDLNAAAGNDEKTKKLCKLPFRKPGASDPNLGALRTMPTARGLPALKKPADVSQEDFDRAVRAAANKLIGWWPDAFGNPAPESIYQAAGKERPAEKSITGDTPMNDEQLSDLEAATGVEKSTLQRILALFRSADDDSGDDVSKQMTDADREAVSAAIQALSGIGDPTPEVEDALAALQGMMSGGEMAASKAEEEDGPATDLDTAGKSTEANDMSEQRTDAEATVEAEDEEDVQPDVSEEEAEEVVEAATEDAPVADKAEATPPDDVEKMIDAKVENMLAPLRKELDEAKKQAAAERDRRIAMEFVEKAKSFRTLPASPDELGTLLKKVYDAAGDEVGDQVYDQLRVADNLAYAGGAMLFKETGTSGGSDENSFMARVEKRAAQLREKDPELAEASAFTQALKQLSREDPASAQAHVRDRQQQTK